MADGTTFVKVTTTQATPEDYLLSGAASIDLLAVRADFDGSGAAGDYVPVVQIVNEANEVMLTVRGDTETAGDSASYTFAPFLRGRASSPAGGGIQFDTEPQPGIYLYTSTSGTDPNFGFAYVFDDLNESGSLFTGPVFVDDQTASFNTAQIGRGFGHRFRLNSGSATFGVIGAGGIFTCLSLAGSDRVSFFSAAPVVQQATPVTLGDVIALLQAYGLSA